MLIGKRWSERNHHKARSEREFIYGQIGQYIKAQLIVLQTESTFIQKWRVTEEELCV